VQLIAAFEVTNAGSDLGLLAQTAGAPKEALGVETIQAVADRGYSITRARTSRPARMLA